MILAPIGEWKRYALSDLRTISSHSSSDTLEYSIPFPQKL
jgi:hypothetical protein